MKPLHQNLDLNSFTPQILYFINSKINIFHIVASEIQVLLKQYIIIYLAAFFNDT